MPDWFLNSSKYPNAVVGYGCEYENSKTNATKRFLSYGETIIKGRLNYYKGISEDDIYKDTDYHFYYSKELYPSTNKSIRLLESYILSPLTKDTIALYSLAEDSVSTELINISDYPKPKWINESVYHSDGFYYGVGLFTYQGRPADAWAKSEENSIARILTFHSNNIFKTNYQIEDNLVSNTEKLISIGFNHSVKGIEIIERFLDIEHHECYTLTRIPKNNIKSKFDE